MSNPAVAAIRAREILSRLPAGRCHVVELGTFLGVLTESLLQQRSDLIVTTVDDWAPGEVRAKAYKATGDFHASLTAFEQEMFQQQAVQRLARFGDRAVIMRMDSAAAAGAVPDASVDLVFVDADHSHEAVTRDTEAWAPKVKPGGWLGWHDYAHPEPRFKFGVTAAVDEFCAARGLELERGDNLTAFARLP